MAKQRFVIGLDPGFVNPGVAILDRKTQTVLDRRVLKCHYATRRGKTCTPSCVDIIKTVAPRILSYFHHWETNFGLEKPDIVYERQFNSSKKMMAAQQAMLAGIFCVFPHSRAYGMHAAQVKRNHGISLQASHALNKVEAVKKVKEYLEANRLRDDSQTPLTDHEADAILLALCKL